MSALEAGSFERDMVEILQQARLEEVMAVTSGYAANFVDPAIRQDPGVQHCFFAGVFIRNRAQGRAFDEASLNGTCAELVQAGWEHQRNEETVPLVAPLDLDTWRNLHRQVELDTVTDRYGNAAELLELAAAVPPSS